MQIFSEHKGKITKEVRRAAEERTGLSWRSIYKWLFDEKSKIPKSKFCVGFQLKDLKDS
jgi:hypothetical protein